MINSDIKDNGLAVLRHVPSYSEHHDTTSRKNFAEIALHVIPVSAELSKRGISARLLGMHLEQEKAHKVLGFIARSSELGVDSTAKNAILDIARNIIYSGSSNYELVTASDGTFSLHWFSPNRLRLGVGNFFRFIFRSVVGILFWRGGNISDKKNVWRIGVPDDLGGTRRHKRLLHKLSLLKIELVPLEIFEASVVSDGSVSGVSLAYHDIADLHCMHLARRWGWLESPRYFASHCTSIFSCYKQLTLRWSAAVLREHIIQEINNLFRRLEIECDLKVSGLLSPAEILEIRDNVYNGDMSIEEALKQTDIHK